MSKYRTETSSILVGEGVWAGHVSGSWNIGDNPNGGYLVAIAMRALTQLSTQHPDPLSVTVHYLRTGLPDQPCEIRTELIRTGRTITTARATLIQDGKSRVEVLAALGDLSSQPQSADKPALTIQAPVIPPVEECVQRSGEEQGVELPLLDRLDIRLHPDEARAGTAGKAQVSGWIRFKDAEAPDSLAPILFVDAFPPSVFGLLGSVGWVPTLELTVQVRRRPTAGWMQGQFQTVDLADGRMIEDGLLWDAAGNLVAQSRQLALVLPRT